MIRDSVRRISKASLEAAVIRCALARVMKASHVPPLTRIAGCIVPVENVTLERGC